MRQLDWVVLTQGDRPDALAAAIRSIRQQTVTGNVIIVANGVSEPVVTDSIGVSTLYEETNLGVPGGRNVGLRATESEIVGFLDDDAELISELAAEQILDSFERQTTIGAVSLRIADAEGSTQRRHIPRTGASGADRPGPAATFLGGACAMRRTAFEAAGGYWPDLFYAHEELDLSWRMHDCGWNIQYLPEVEVRHPPSPISRHPEGWFRTGRNRVWIARRNLPWALAAFHLAFWTIVGTWRAPGLSLKRSYLAGLRSAWTTEVRRSPISWSTAARLAKAGRFPAW